MKLIIFFLCTPFVSSELHTFITSYTGVTGVKRAGISKFSAVATLDGQQVDYYDRNEKKLIPKQNWAMKIESKTHMIIHNIKDEVQQIYKNNILSLMQHRSRDVHVVQGMFGCEWDDQSRVQHVFDQYRFDERDFITLDLKNSRYVASVPEAEKTVMKWNNDSAQLNTLQDYYKNGCFYWLWKSLTLTEETFQNEEPKVSLLLDKPDLVRCHVTSFYSNNTVILWRKNGKVVKNLEFVKSGDALPNEDGTFQRTVTLSVPPHDWKINQYYCEVKHMGKTTRKILTENEGNGPSITKIVCMEIIAALFLLGFFIKKFKCGVSETR